MPPDHDRLFKLLLRTFFSGFLRLVVPDLAEQLDAKQALFLDKELLGEQPSGKRLADLLARVPVRSGGVLLVHVEIQARASPKMPSRLRDYAARIQVAYGEQVLSIVVNLRRGPAGVNQGTLKSTLSASELSSFRYTAFGLARCNGTSYLASSEPVAWALAALMRRGQTSRAAYKLNCQEKIVEAQLSEDERTLLLDFVEEYLKLTPSEAEEYKILSARNRRRTQAMWMTWSERQKAEGKKEGLAEGARSLQQVLIHLLNQRFGPLPERVQKQVEAIKSLPRLTRLAEQVLVVGSIRELRLR